MTQSRAGSILFAVGVLLTLTATLLFVRGFWRTEELRVRWTRQNDPRYLFVEENVFLAADCRRFTLVEQRLHIAAEDDFYYARQPFEIRHVHFDAPRFTLLSSVVDELPGRLGFAFRAPQRLDTSFPGQRNFASSVPAWFAVLACAVPTALPGWRRWRRRRAARSRAARGQCLACGYDLRGATHERCPECGETLALEARV